MYQKRPIDVFSAGGGNASLLTMMGPLIEASEKLTHEEKLKNAEKYKEIKKQEMIKAKILQNICPICDGKLVRGKKDKKNKYKRAWTCSTCGSVHSI